MGMSYEYVGSASYPRFTEEITAIAKYLGGVKVTPDAVKDSLNDWMGEGLSSEKVNFEFSSKVPKCVQKLLNFPYGKFTVNETRKCAEFFAKKNMLQELHTISEQFVEELCTRAINHEAWEIIQ